MNKLCVSDVIAAGWTVLPKPFPPQVYAFTRLSSNFMFTIDFGHEVPFIMIRLKDPLRERRMPYPESFKVCMPCPDVAAFNFIFNLLYEYSS